MRSFSASISFCYPWRSYQKDVLHHLESHLKNNHLHLVAPPGSGKTVLGLEVMLRLNKSTLIVAPTLAIRNQWVDRFTTLFLQTKTPPDWISTDIRNPQFVTVTTYQGLHSLFQKTRAKNDDDNDHIDDGEKEVTIIENTEREKSQEKLFEQNFQTLILDEAHHLRTSWWKTAISFRKQLKNPCIVALTATPPYDVSKTEWDRYIELCGPIDEEIEIAALVKENDLCPHQDYLWMSMPTPKEKEPINTFHRETKNLINSLIGNKAFQALIESHEWIQSAAHVEEKLANYSYFISMIVYLKQVDSIAWQKPFQLVETSNERLPSFDLEWAEELLTGLLYLDERVNPKEEPLKQIRRELSAIGAIERRRVKLIATKSMERTLLHSASKLDSITKIVSVEKQSLHTSLRLVILADYIYADDLPTNAETMKKPLIRLGVIPIFEKLRREMGERCRLGVLTGSVVMLPKEAVPQLRKHLLDFQSESLEVDENYVKISPVGASRQHLVRAMTAIFSTGEIDVLVGTTALLGEGWDAPSVNTLILASYVGTFMLTNQMRGRAIRAEQGNLEKAANIWHLVCVDPQVFDGGYDFQSLKRRFRSLSGLDESLPLISSGLERLRIQTNQFSQQAISQINVEMTKRATNRNRLRDKWQEAVYKGKAKREEFQVDKSFIPRPFVFRNTLKSLLVISVVMILNTLYYIGEHSYITNFREFGYQLFIGFGLGGLLSFPFWWKALRIFIFNTSIESSMKQVGQAVYHTLYDIGLIQTKPVENKVHAEKNDDGHVICYIENGNTHEQKLFLQSLQEIVDPITNPRYILHRKSGKRFWIRHDYHAIPEEIGRKREYADLFLTEWKKRIGEAELVYTRTLEGRELLLKARLKAMSSKFLKRSQRISVWR